MWSFTRHWRKSSNVTGLWISEFCIRENHACASAFAMHDGNAANTVAAGWPRKRRESKRSMNFRAFTWFFVETGFNLKAWNGVGKGARPAEPERAWSGGDLEVLRDFGWPSGE